MNEETQKKPAWWAAEDSVSTIPVDKIYGLSELLALLHETAHMDMRFMDSVAFHAYEGKPPSYATEGSAGIDLRYSGTSILRIPAKSQMVVPTGVCIHIKNKRMGGKLHARSGNAAKHKIRLANGTGVIDSDYIDEIGACLVNDGDKDFDIHVGDRICQLVIEPVIKVCLHVVSELTETTRDGGWGSTGDK